MTHSRAEMGKQKKAEKKDEKVASKPDEIRQAVMLPKRARHTLAPLIVSTFVVALEIFVAFYGMIQDSVHGADTTDELKSASGVLSAGTIQFHLTWGLMLSVTLSFVENSLSWTTNRTRCNFFGGLNVLLSLGFFLAAIYTWLWANDAAGIVMICKYFLVNVGVRLSPDQIRLIAYTDKIKLGIDLCVSWLLPAQCLLVFINCILSQCACDGIKDELPVIIKVTQVKRKEHGTSQILDKNGATSSANQHITIYENAFQCRIDWAKFSQQIDTK